MSKFGNLCVVGAGVCISSLCVQKRKPFTLGILAASSLFYVGSLLEFENILVSRPLNKKSLGYWAFKGGVLGVGLVSGSVSLATLNMLKSVCESNQKT